MRSLTLSERSESKGCWRFAALLSIFIAVPAVAQSDVPTQTPVASPVETPSAEPTATEWNAATPTPSQPPVTPTPTPTPTHAPVVRGGIYDKPYLQKLGGRTALGGYADIQARHERTDGVVEETTFVAERFNLFTFSNVSDRVRVSAELEIEEMGEEITLETAIVDFEIHEMLVLRVGVILSPLGRFNLAHDSPANDLVERPLVSTEILAATLSEPGMGVWGAAYPYASARVSWEAYLVNGFDERVIGTEDGTRIAAGKGAAEDANATPSMVARLAVSPVPQVEIGLSGHRGPYNTWMLEGETIDARRELAIAAIDVDARGADWAIAGEAARAWIDVPPGFAGLLADEQAGWYVEGRYRFGSGLLVELPESAFVVALRHEHVDFDLDRKGDDTRRAIAGLSFRPTPETAFKLDAVFTRNRDRFALPSASTAVLLGIATYF